ncbi:Nif3-like dinuclear metal center hexameric protein [Sphingomonas sp. ASY06-1R]|jgi:putative NIF3 family GTP cyclohydrolase 1 type 2|uniref:Nif3-like dinuclear metal center hexameric protein n=1 Tax=Sphingomonas sp. ASY06-1R TaxID=3445771 RepID=UPI003FA1C321
MFSRRDLCLTGGQVLMTAGLSGPAIAQRRRNPAAQEIATALLGVGRAELLAGDPDSAVRAIALVTDPTLAALRKAVAAGCSLILSPETPFYGKPPDPAAASGPFAAMAESAAKALRDSPALRAKQALIADHKLAVYRVSPQTGYGADTSVEALAAKLGWSDHRAGGARPIYRPPALTLSALVALAHARLDAEGGLRFIGDPAMRLSSILLVPGTAEVVSTTQALRHADALLTGDLREWELVEYVHDSAEAGIPKALVSTGRILSERPFLERCGQALERVFPHVRQHRPISSDPFWRVQA